MAEREAPLFPSPVFPEDADQKLLGIYRQRDDRFVLQRVRVPGGRLTAAQLRALSDLARDVGARPALHLTTRQDIELHDLRPEVIPQVQQALADAGLTSLGAAGDTVRNSTVDPLGGLAPGNADLFPLARAIETAALSIDGIWSLPRKFKLSYSGDESARMRPYASDVGVIARADGLYDVVVAGSLGAKPRTGILFAQTVDAADVAAIALAAIRVHAVLGNRSDRRRARLRHVREEIGEQRFADTLEALVAEERREARVRVPEAPAAPAQWPSHLRLGVPRGDVPLDQADELAGLLERTSGEIRLGIEHDLHLFGVDGAQLSARLADQSRAGRVVACPGVALCSKAAGPTAEAALELAPLAQRHPDLLFALSGCPNSCSHAAAADVGFVSRMATVNGVRRPLFKILDGGDAGAGAALAVPVATDVTLDELTHNVERVLEQRLR